MKFNVYTACTADSAEIRLVGSMYDVNADILTAEISSTSKMSIPKDVIVDMTNLVFIDASGIAAIIRLNKIVRKGSGKVQIAKPFGIVKELLCVVGMDKIFHITEEHDLTVEERKVRVCPIICAFPLTIGLP